MAVETFHCVILRGPFTAHLFEYELHNIMQQETGGGLLGTLASQNKNRTDERNSVIVESGQTYGKRNIHSRSCLHSSHYSLIGDLEKVTRRGFYGAGKWAC